MVPMGPSTFLACNICRSPLRTGESICPQCGAPVSAIGGVRTPAPDGRDTPASYPPGSGTFSWDAVVQRLRELAIGEYEILHELGRGGMAAVFLAHEFALNRKVALKVMSPAMMMGDGMIDRFYSEAVTQANLVHPNIVGVHAVRQEEDLHYFVMQYVPGRSLLQVLREEMAQGRLLSIPVVRALVHQIGSALAFAHRRGVIHRDIKPANVLLSGHGDAVVTDFGIAKVAANPSQTMTGTVVGTAPYMSPEQCYALELTGNSDQYSLGILMYELLTGAPPFSGNSFVVMQAHALQEPAPLQSKRPDCPPELAAAVMRMLAKATEDRFPDVGEAIAALGATPASTHANDPVRIELIRLSDVQGVEAGLTGAHHVPLSPVPRTRRGSDPRRPTVPTPQRAIEANSPADRAAADPLAQPIALLRLANLPSRLEVGEWMRLTATATGPDGSIVQDVTLRWSSSNPKVARVRPESGEIEALSPGRADIVASAGDAVATVNLEISEATVRTIVVAGPPSVEVGDTGTITAEATDSRGARIDRAIAWSAADPSVARVNRDGTVTAVATGTTKLFATTGGVRGELQLQVIRAPVARIEISGIPSVVGAGEAMTATAALFDKRGSAIDPRAPGGQSVRWESTDPGVLSVSATGGCKAVRPGSVRIAARADGAVAMLDVTVGVVPIARIDVTGIAGSMRVGASRRISVTASDAEGLTRQLPVEWSSSDPEVAAIEAGQLVARGAGQTTLRLQCGTMERSFPVAVQEVVPLTVRLREVWQRPGARIAAGVLGLAVTGLLVVAFLPDAPAVVDSSAPQSGGAAKADPAPAQPSGGAEGTTPSAIVPAVETSDSVPRVAAPLADARVSIGSSRQRDMEAGASLSLRAALDPPPPGASTITWASSDPAVATVAALDRRSGRVTALNAGAATIRASAGSGRDSIVVIVRSPTLARLEITGAPATLTVGDSIQMSAAAFSRANRPMAVSGTTWHSSNPNVLSINPLTGVARGNASGSTEIHTAGGSVRSRSWTVNVQAAQRAESRSADSARPDRGSTRAAPDPDIDAPAGAALVVAARDAATACRDTYATRNAARIDALARGGSRTEEGNRGFLLSTLRDFSNVAIASTGPLGEPELDGTAAHVRIPMRATWRDSFRRDQSANLTLHAELQRRGNAWTLTSCRIVERR